MKKNFKIRIFQPVVQEYRVALHEGLADRYGDRIEIWASPRRGVDVSIPLKKMRYDYSHKFFKFGPFIWQTGFSLKGLSKGDVIVVCGDLHQLSSLWIAFKARCKGIKVVWWGHHKTATSSSRNVRIRLAIAKWLSDVMLVYTRTGIDYLLNMGFKNGRVFATGNTIDQKPICDAIESYDGQDPFKGKIGFLCCSVLREKVKLDLAIRALSDNRLSNVVLAVIGEGPAKQGYMNLASELGVADRVIWIGATRDQQVMAPWFLNAKGFVYPGSVGLSILHAMSYGLPVIVHNNPEHQMPEYEIMEDGNTGLCFKEDSVDSLVEKMVVMKEDSNLRNRMSKIAKDYALSKYSMEAMVNNFSEALDVAMRL